MGVGESLTLVPLILKGKGGSLPQLVLAGDMEQLSVVFWKEGDPSSADKMVKV